MSQSSKMMHRAAMALAAALASQALPYGLPHCTADTSQPDTSDLDPPQPDQPDARAVSNQHTAKWRIYTDMGRELIIQRRHAEAEPYFRMAMDCAVEGFGPRDGHVASSANNLAELYRVLGRTQDAEPLYKQALELLENEYGPHDVRLAAALHNAASVYVANGDLQHASTLLTRSLAIKRAALGDEAIELVDSLRQLAEVHVKQGNLAAAVKGYTEAIHVAQASIGHKVRNMKDAALQSAKRLVALLTEAGRASEAVPVLRGLLQASTKTLGEKDITTAHVHELLASALQSPLRKDGSRRWWGRSVSDGKAQCSALHEAVQHRQTSLEIRKAAFGPRSVAVATGHAGVAGAWLMLASHGCADDALARAHAAAAEAVDVGAAAWAVAVAQTDLPWWTRQWRRFQGTELPSLVPWTIGLEYARSLVVLGSVLQRQGAVEESAACLARAEAVLQGEHMRKALAQAGGRASALVHALETELSLIRDACTAAQS